MDIKIIDNSSSVYQLKAFLEEKLILKDFSQLSIATGYWDLPVMVELLTTLETFLSNNSNSEIRLLIGEEPTIRTTQLDKAFPEKYLNKDLKELSFKEEYQIAVDFVLKQIEEKRILVKLYKGDFLHAKCYIIGNVCERAIGIIGSSNFTKNGILKNTELNAVETDHRIVNFIPQGTNLEPSHRSWFENLWNNENSFDWNFQFKTEIIGLSKFGDITYSPYEMYIRTIYEIYKEDIEIEQQLKTEDNFASRVDLATFQEESVRKVKARLNHKHIRMCLLADSVGLGKSFIAKKILEEYGYHRRQNVVVICPASLREDWKGHLADITVNAPVYSITEFGNDNSFKKIKNELLQRKITSKRENAIDLLVIDESHNLKTQGANSLQNLLTLLSENEFCKYEPKVLMLSATPVNNGIKDLANQILLAKSGNVNAFNHFGISDFTKNFRDVQRDYIKSGNEEIFTELFPILNKILVKRTRHQVKKDFPDAQINNQKIIFPNENLENILYELDSKEIRKSISSVLNKLSKSKPELFDFFIKETTEIEDEKIEMEGVLDFFKFATKKPETKKTVNTEYESIFHFIDKAIKGLKLIPYSFLTHKIDKTSEEELQAKSRSNLTGIFKVTLFKSFDSSIYTFRKRIKKYEKFLTRFEDLFFKENKIVKSEIVLKTISEYTKEEDFNDLLNKQIEKYEISQKKKRERLANEGKIYKIQYAYTEINLDEFQNDVIKKFIEQDKNIINLIFNVLNDINIDSKLIQLKKWLNNIKGKKVLVFSYFATTINYLKEEINKDSELLKNLGIGENEIVFLTSSVGREFIHDSVKRFSPVAQKVNKINNKIDGKPEIKTLFTTDVLSEGQNLQDCGIIINYDLHWNPVKMIQRNGRINRLGSTHENIHIYNFLPEIQLDKFLKLMKKLQEKIKIIGATVGLDNQVLGEQITPREFGLIEKLYSKDKNNQTEAIEELERENDLAFDEQFENDLREFFRRATDEEKEKLLSMNFNKWCGIQTLKSNEKILTFKTGEKDFDFFKIQDNNKFEIITNKITALNLIRNYNSNVGFDTERQIETIKWKEKENLIQIVNQHYIQQNAVQLTLDGLDLAGFMGVNKSGGVSSLANEKEALLELLNENIENISSDNVNRIRKILLSKNIAVDKKLRRLLQNYNNQICFDLLDDIQMQANNILKTENEEIEKNQIVKPSIWFGFYKK